VAQTRARRAREEAERALRESRDRLELLLAQKTALLQEVNHRVANSLQLISSLISIQAARIADPGARDALQLARERVQAVMLVHRRLYTSDEVGLVEIDKYLLAMGEELQASVLAADHRIVINAQPLSITPDKAVSVGVIVNELITNALKYAFPSGRNGTIRVTLTRPSETEVVLVVADDGVGHPVETDAPKGTGLGTLIMNAMAKTLNGAVERLPSEIGSRVVLTFPPN
jgi:two-component sensor histidine kinase